MLQLPRQLNKLHIIRQEEKQFVADLEQCRVFEVKGLVCDILFNELNRRRRYPKPQIPNTSIFFTPFLHESNGRVDVQSVLAGVTADKRKLLMFESYIQSVEEGLALALLKNHTWHEVEAILHEFCGHEGAKDVIRRVRQFLETLSI